MLADLNAYHLEFVQGGILRYQTLIDFATVVAGSKDSLLHATFECNYFSDQRNLLIFPFLRTMDPIETLPPLLKDNSRPITFCIYKILCAYDRFSQLFKCGLAFYILVIYLS